MTDANLPPCCPPGSWPQLLWSNDDPNAPKPKGKLVTVKTATDEEIGVYLVEPPSEKKKNGCCVMVLQDVYSVRVLGSKIGADRSGAICDALAEEGYTVALPSLFGPITEAFDLAVCGPDKSKGETHTSQNVFTDAGAEWFKRHNYEKIKPNIVACTKFLQEQMGGSPLKMGVVLGFCYGNWAFAKTSSEQDVNFSCAGVGCHPSTVLETLVYGGNEIEMLNKLGMPTLFLAAGNDSESYVEEDGPARAALEKTGGGVTVFPEMVHGWVSRGDSSDDNVKRDVEKAMTAIVDFYNKHLQQ